MTDAVGLNPEAKQAALALALEGTRSPLAYEQNTDEQLLDSVKQRAPGATDEDCLLALAAVRTLADHVYDVCDAFRDGACGEGEQARDAALQELAGDNPGFTSEEMERAFEAGLLWTAF